MVVASAPTTFEEIGMIYNIIVSFFPIGYYQGKKNENTSKSGKSRKEKKTQLLPRLDNWLFFIKKKMPGLNVLTWS